MERLTERNQSIDDILFEMKCMAFFQDCAKEYRNSQLGFMFMDLHKLTKGHFLRLVRMHEKDFGEKLDIKMMRGLR